MEHSRYKFRAWDKFNGVYIYSDKFPNLAKFFEECQKFIDGGNELVFQQFTGLRDKNGKEIYEGDIINTVNGIKKVLFSEDIGCFEAANNIGSRTIYGYIKDGGVQVIGNRFENPELLEAKP